MARQTKPGLGYFPADTDRYSNMKIKRLKHVHNGIGMAIYDFLLHEIYRVDGYFIKLDQNMIYEVSIYWNLQEDKVKEIILYCIEIGLFNAEMYQKHGVLTSKSIQEKYIFICNQSRKSSFKVDNYMITAEGMPINVAVMAITAEGMPINDTESTQSKVNKSKVNKSKKSSSIEDDVRCIDIIDYLNLICKANYKYLTVHSIYIHRRLNEGFVIDDFKKVIDYKFKEWNNTEYQKHLVPFTLFGDKFDGYLQQSKNPNLTLKPLVSTNNTPAARTYKNLNEELEAERNRAVKN